MAYILSSCNSLSFQFLIFQFYFRSRKRKNSKYSELTCCLIQARACHHEICNTWNIFFSFYLCTTSAPVLDLYSCSILLLFFLHFLTVYFHTFLLYGWCEKIYQRQHIREKSYDFLEKLFKNARHINRILFSIMSLHPFCVCLYECAK